MARRRLCTPVRCRVGACARRGSPGVAAAGGWHPGAPPVDTVFFGGGTPTLLPPAALLEVLARIRSRFGLAPGAEVTTECNPDTVSRRELDALREGGFTRISFGMQSAVPHVLRVLDR